MAEEKGKTNKPIQKRERIGIWNHTRKQMIRNTHLDQETKGEGEQKIIWNLEPETN